jgi:small redox-active disulfide protein 2
MFRSVLFAVDFSSYTEKILAFSGELAGAGVREAILLHVVDARHTGHGVEEMKERAESRIETLVEQTRGVGLETRGLVVVGTPAEEILRVAKKEGASFIYLGGHGHGFAERVLFGSVIGRVLKHADRTVLVHKCRIRKEGSSYSCENVHELLFENVLVAADFSHYFESLRPILEEFLRSCCQRLTLLHVQEEGELWGLDTDTMESEKTAEQNLEKLKGLSSCLQPHCEFVDTKRVMGNPASSMLRVASEINASLLVVGAFAHKESLEGLLGGIAEEVARQSEVPVLVVKPEPTNKVLSGNQNVGENAKSGVGGDEGLLLVRVYSTEVCPRCKKLFELVKEVVEVKGIPADVQHVTDAKAIADAGIIASPALVIDEKIVASGWIPGKKEIERFLTRR